MASVAKMALVISANTSAAASTLSSFGSKLGGFAAGAVSSVAGIGSAIMSAGKYLMSFAEDDVAKNIAAMYGFAKVTGASTEALAGLQLAAGMDWTKFQQAMSMFVKTLGGMEVNSDAASKKFAKFGLDAEKLSAMPVDQALLEIAGAYTKLSGSSEKAALAMAAFGKKGIDMMKVLARGKAGLEEYIQKAKDFGLSFDMNQGKAVGEAVRAVKEWKLLMSGFKQQAILNLAPIATPVARLFIDVGKSVMAVVKEFWGRMGPTIQAGLARLSPLLGKIAAVAKNVLGGALLVAGKYLERTVPILLQWWTTLISIGEAIGRLAGRTINWLSGMLGGGDWMASLSSAFDSVTEFIAKAMIGVEFAANNLEKLWGLIDQGATLALEVAADRAAEFFMQLPEIAHTSLQQTLDWWVWLGKNIVGAVGEAFNAVKDMGGKVFDWIKGGMQGDLDLGIGAAMDNVKAKFAEPPKVDWSNSFKFGDLSADQKKRLAALSAGLGDVAVEFDSFMDGRLKELFGDKVPAMAKAGMADAADEMAEAIQPKFASAIVAGSGEALSLVTKFRYESDLQAHNDPQVTEQKKTNGLLKDIKDTLAKPGEFVQAVLS